MSLVSITVREYLSLNNLERFRAVVLNLGVGHDPFAKHLSPKIFVL